MLHKELIVFVKAVDEVGDKLVGSGQKPSRKLYCFQVKNFALDHILIGVHPQVLYAFVYVVQLIFSFTESYFRGDCKKCS